MRLIRFSPLQIDSTKVRVEWTVDPPTQMYQQTAFELDYGDALDPRELPLRFWWTIVPLILHSHWNLLRPCRVILPVTLPAGEIEFWLRLLDQERVSLEMSRKTTDFTRNIEITGTGPEPSSRLLSAVDDRWSTAFSGGRDSLAQTALLSETTQRPLLVNTCAPMPPLIDHEWPFRERALREIVRRRDTELVVVKSNLRRLWPHYEFPHQLGYPMSLGLMGDPHLVLANTLVVAASRGIRSVTLAAELELSRIEEYEGRPCFNEWNFAYNVPVFVALDQLFRKFGLEIGSLILPFTQFQLQSLLRKRYADLGDLQISCFWMKEDTERWCNQCWKCFRAAMILLAHGQDPATLDLDLYKMFGPGSAFAPKSSVVGATRTVAHAARILDTQAVKSYCPRKGLLEKIGLREPATFQEFTRVVNRFAAVDWPGVAATHENYFQYVPGRIRERIRAISLEEWPEIDTTSHVPDDANISSVSRWMTATL